MVDILAWRRVSARADQRDSLAAPLGGGPSGHRTQQWL